MTLSTGGFRRLISGLLIAVLLGCGDTGRAATEAMELSIAAPADAYGTTSDADFGIYPVNANIYEPLVRLTPDYQIEPWLATGWEFRPPNSWRFHLRRDVRMHDGSTFTAEAVRWTMSRVATMGGGTLGMGDSSVHVIDDYTVEITPTRPNLRLLQQLAHPNWSILAPGTEPAERAVGTGPFRLAEYAKGDHLTVERFPDYWSEKARLERLTFRFLPDPNTRVLALRSGQADVAYDLPREAAQSVSGFPGVRVARSGVGGYSAIYMNLHGEPPHDLGRDPAIRRALVHAIDRREIVENVWLGNAEPTLTIVPASILGESAGRVRGFAYDPSLARRILEDAGWRLSADGIRVRNGRRLSLVMIVGFPNPDIHRPMPEVVQAQLRAVGIEMKIVQTTDNAAYQARVRSGEGDLWAEAGGQNDGNPCFLLDLLFYSAGPTGSVSRYARLFGPGPRFDRFIDACRAAVDPAEVQRSAAEAMRVLVDEERVVIPLAGTYRIWGLSERVQGFEPHPSSLSQRWEGVWLSR
jgi:peptide/nickel transport system substrate-binding protein